MLFIYLNQIYTGIVDTMYSFVHTRIEQTCLETIFWYNKTLVQSKHYLHNVYQTNVVFRTVYDVCALVYHFIKRVFSFLSYHLFYVDHQPDGTWLSIVSVRKDSDSTHYINIYYTTFGQLANTKSNYEVFSQYAKEVLVWLVKIFMGTEYCYSLHTLEYTDMDASVKYTLSEQDEDTSSEMSDLDMIEKEVDDSATEMYTVSTNILSTLAMDHIECERNHYKELHNMYDEYQYVRKQNVVYAVNRDGVKYEYLDNMYVSEEEGMQRYSPLTQSMVIAHKNGAYEFRTVHWLTDVQTASIAFQPSLVDFLEVDYHHPDMEESIPILLTESMMMVNTELLSYAFIGWYLKKLPAYTKYVFDDRYTIQLLDDNINMVKLRSNQYIKLGVKTYEVMEGVLM
jgi:hypothetical protein